ncbi:MAG: hypothetical protein GTN49_11120 [candidate division Zixibacteria bacterium]|nr:hypothetical protein [candidate division Zixibacteria bacterium]
MKRYAITLAVCAVVAAACQRVGDAAGAPEAGRPVRLIFPEAARAETLLKSSGIRIENRNDLIREFPEGCVWHAVYSSTGAEVILEAYAFADDGRAREYGAERNGELLAMDILREFAVATNGPLVLVAYYDPTEDAAAKRDALEKFVEAFSGEG